MDTVLIIAADGRELAGLERRIGPCVDLKWSLDYSRGIERGSRRWLLLANGPGPRLAKQALDVACERERPRAVINTGYCGALDPALMPGQVVAAIGVVDLDTGVRWPADPPEAAEVARGWVVSGDRVISSVEEKSELRGRFGAVMVDMESAALAEGAASRGIPFQCVRAVSDTASEGFGIDFNAARGTDGRFRVSALLLSAAARPAVRVPELLRLARRAKLASENLGEFFASRI